ncbi:glycosyltransferase family 4 protein [Magnetofaba australis]|uniref:Putative group 1 glycosyl transferase n=1 Tax=Magnetofaba australis IT-1 TaxID=1434232 RepID=A0A1Y2K3M1_9PROT|nr:glycosyltransferase family 4 protein [Magnetofaba australis]OSM02539.1 putative group 1 glycosyl transferase [Magnetofaba australis IT-1]
MRILMLTSDYPPDIGGIAAHVHHLAHTLAARGHEITVASVWLDIDQREAITETSGGVTLHRVPGFAHWLGRDITMHRRRLRALARRLQTNTPFDVAHIHGHAWEAFASRRLPGRPPIVGTMHASGFRNRCKSASGRAKLRRRLRHLNAIIAPSAEIAQAAESLHLPRAAIHAIPNAVDADKFTPGAPEGANPWGIDPGNKIVLCLQRIAPVKGTIHLARAARRILDAHPDARLIFAGSETPEYAAQVKHILDESGAMPRCRFLGSVPNDQTPALLRLAQVSVTPSLMEATSIACLEAMACGVAVVGSEVGGIPELIVPGEHGLLTPVGDAHAIADAVIALLDDPQQAKAMGQRGRQRVEENFDWRIAAQKVEAVYTEILEPCET